MAKITLVAEGTYELRSVAGRYSFLALDESATNITYEKMLELYNQDTYATVVFNGSTYYCKPFCCSGEMGSEWGYGNPIYPKYSVEAGSVEDTGEPFAISCYGTDCNYDWTLWCNPDITTCTISAYITDDSEDEPDTATYRWKVQSEKTVLLPECVSAGSDNILSEDNEEFRALCASGTTITVICDGVYYKCEPVRFEGMDSWIGYGNLTDIWQSEGVGEQPKHNNEPFAIISYDYDDWHVSFDAPEGSTISAYIEGEQTLVSVGKNDNSISRTAGSIIDDVFTAYQSSLATPFNLAHDKDWALEFRMQFVRNPSPPMSKIWDNGSKWSVVARETSKSISICYRDSSHTHYGVKLDGYGIDLYTEHTYRLQNRINADGTNMVYLYVDGVEIAPMTDKFTASSSSGVNDYLSGNDFSFGYMGANSYTVDGFTLDDIAVWESGAEEAFKETVDYVITYESAFGEVPASKVVTVKEGESYSLTEADLPVLKADGYVFNGWVISKKASHDTSTARLLSVDGYALRDMNGLYIIQKEDE